MCVKFGRFLRRVIELSDIATPSARSTSVLKLPLSPECWKNVRECQECRTLSLLVGLRHVLRYLSARECIPHAIFERKHLVGKYTLYICLFHVPTLLKIIND